MAEKKKTKTTAKTVKLGKPPTLEERITDFSTDSHSGKPILTPRRKKR